MWSDIVLNILLFLPIGLIIGSKWGIVIGSILACTIEILQYSLHRGFCEIDDVVNNVIGAAVGVAIWKTIKKMEGKKCTL